MNPSPPWPALSLDGCPLRPACRSRVDGWRRFSAGLESRTGGGPGTQRLRGVAGWDGCRPSPGPPASPALRRLGTRSVLRLPGDAAAQSAGEETGRVGRAARGPLIWWCGTYWSWLSKPPLIFGEPSHTTRSLHNLFQSDFRHEPISISASILRRKGPKSGDAVALTVSAGSACGGGVVPVGPVVVERVEERL